MSMDSEDGFERGFVAGWEARMRAEADHREQRSEQVDDTAQQGKVSQGEWLARQQRMQQAAANAAIEARYGYAAEQEQQAQIMKMQGVRAGQ